MDSRFVVQARDENVGWVRNVNGLLAQVESDYFMIKCLHDDAIRRRYLNTLLDALLSQGAAIVAFSDLDLIVREVRQQTLTYDRLTNVTQAEARAREIFHRAGAFFLPYRGLVRTKLMADAMKLRLNAAGEFKADLVWVLELALRGEFVRVPEVLYLKYLQETSLSRTWKPDRESVDAPDFILPPGGPRIFTGNPTVGKTVCLIESSMV